MESRTTEEDFWKDRDEAEIIFSELSSKKKKVQLWQELMTRIKDLSDLSDLVKETVNEDEVVQLEKEYEILKKDFEVGEVDLLLNGTYDSKNVILSIHAGTGGVDAQDWAEMLLRMYLRYAEYRGYKSNILSIISGEEAGIKSAILMIEGVDVYGYLKSESGVHRLVRQSPYNAKNLRQTSFALVEVSPYFDKDVQIEVKKDDLRIDTYRASGHGGQKVNKTDSAVRVTHIPTGIAVACQNERSQLQNKETAMRILMSKLYVLKQEEIDKKEKQIKGEVKQGTWGNQIRSYVLHPYKMVKDHRTDCETSQVEKVLDGEIDEFIEAYLRKKNF